MQLLPGTARKLSIPVVAPIILGWVVFVIGFALYNHSDVFEDQQDFVEEYDIDDENGVYEDHRASVYYFPYWLVIVSGPILFISLAVHLVFGRWFTGIFTTLLAAIYLVSGGGVVYRNGILLFSESVYDGDDIIDKDDRLYILIEWVGCLASLLFLTLHLAMWSLFSQPQPQAQPQAQAQPQVQQLGYEQMSNTSYNMEMQAHQIHV